MRALIHESVRWLIRQLVVLLGIGLECVHRRKIRAFDETQARLRARYGIGPHTPIRGFDEVQKASLEAAARATGREVFLAATSGSTNEPKRVPYTRARVKAVKWVYVDSFARAYARLRIQRPSLYVFSALKRDDSLTALMLDEAHMPPYLSTLQAPYRVHAHPGVQALVESFGATSVRVFVLAVSNPGLLYATNPSTLSTFFDRLELDYGGACNLVRAWVRDPGSVPEIVHRLRRRLDSPGAEDRLRALAAAERAPPISTWLPGLAAYVTWDGGDLAPFLRRLERHLDPSRYRRIPMYSMSTETVETVSHYSARGVGFLPLAPGVHYELLPEEAPDEAARLIGPRDAQLGERYLLVVSDRYGLRRYQTEDVFAVVGHVDGLPDLRFVRRRGLRHSFTGEKLTGEQASLAFGRLRAENDLAESVFLSLLPVDPKAAAAPHYDLAIVGAPAGTAAAALAKRLDGLLAEQNGEYASKRESGRLGPVRARPMSVEDFAELVGGERHRGSWEAQLKFLPLYPRCFDDAQLEADA